MSETNIETGKKEKETTSIGIAVSFDGSSKNELMIVQVRTDAGWSDVDWAAEIDKQIALAIAADPTIITTIQYLVGVRQVALGGGPTERGGAVMTIRSGTKESSASEPTVLMPPISG